jgi:hypothetical protein
VEYPVLQELVVFLAAVEELVEVVRAESLEFLV